MFERREWERFVIKDSFVRYRQGLLFQLDKKPEGRDFPLINISRQGLQFISHESLSETLQLNLSLDIPSFCAPINLQAKVCWKEGVPGKPLYKTGVRFVRIPQTDSLKIEFLCRDRQLRTKPRDGKES